MPSVILARKAAALAAKGQPVTGGGEDPAYRMPGPPPLRGENKEAQDEKKETRADAFSAVRYVDSPASCVSAFSLPSSSPQSDASSTVVSPQFGPYSFPTLSLSTSSLSSGSSEAHPSQRRRSSLPPSIRGEPLQPPQQGLVRQRSSVHLLVHPVLQQRLRKSRWVKVQMAMRMKQRWKAYRHQQRRMEDTDEAPGDADRGHQSADDDDDDDADMEFDDILDADNDGVQPPAPPAAPALTPTPASSPYNPYAADNRVVLTLHAPARVAPRMSIIPPVLVCPAPLPARVSQLASRRHTNPTRGSPLLSIEDVATQAKRSPAPSSSSLAIPLSPASVSPRLSPRSPSSASLRSRHLSLLTSAPSSPRPFPSPLGHAAPPASTAVIIDHFALCLTLQYLDLPTLLQAKAVSWLWYEHANSPLSWLYTTLRLHLVEEDAETEPPLPLPPFLSGMPCTHARIPRVLRVTSTFVETLAVSVRYLRALDLSSLPGALSVSALSAVLSATPFVQSLSLSYNPWLSDGHLAVLPALLPRLRYLDVACSAAVTKEGLAALHPLRLLSLDLSSCAALSDVDLEALLRLPTLLSLSLSSNKRLTPLALSFLCHALPHLLILDAAWTAIASSPSSSTLTMLQQLLILNLSYSRHVDDDALRIIGQLRHLHTLDLFACQHITDVGVEAMCGIQTLAERQRDGDQPLDSAAQAESAESTDEAPDSPKHFPLRFGAMASPRLLSAPPSPPPLSAASSLSLPFASFVISSRHASPKVNARSLRPVKAVGMDASVLLPSLSSLSIGALPMVSADVLSAGLCRLTALLSVDVQFSRMDDAGLRRIGEEWRRRARPRGRRSINTSWCKLVTEKGRQTLRDAAPDCEVV